LSDLNLVSIKLNTGETLFAELLSINEYEDILLSNILQVYFDGNAITASPYFPFTAVHELTIKKLDIRFCEPLEEEYYSFYCNVVIASRSVMFDIKKKIINNKEVDIKRELTLSNLKTRFSKWIVQNNFDFNNKKVTIH